jgi:hypothetical protein
LFGLGLLYQLWAYISDIPLTFCPFLRDFGVLSPQDHQARGKPMIQHVNDMIERTHRLTGIPREEVVRRGLIRKEIPMYTIGGGAVMGGLAAQDEYQPQ